MANDYHDLANVTAVERASALTIPRAGMLCDAVQRHRDYSLVQLLRYPVDGEPTIECLIVDVECDGVPPKNTFGIRYRERLALCVPEDPKKLVDVLALRVDFPTLIHQNQSVPGAPASLCLYFESPMAVMRTWTPVAFLRRIQWWLEQSARGTLHPVDQPVEHLFFASKYELVLPWNWAQLRKNPALRWIVVRRQQRPDGGFTCFLQLGDLLTTTTTAHIELTLPAVEHGVVERDPVTLGQLADSLVRRGIDLLTHLRAALQERVGDGVTATADDQGTVVLLHIPIRRGVDAEPDAIAHRAFLVVQGALRLGVDTGALVLHQGRYYRDLFNTQPPTAWRDQPVLPMGVLTQNDGTAARRQSGIIDEGPAGVLVGVGSLGSALLNLWGRDGWGRWTVVDKDHIKPHNISRHTAYAQHIGESKATVVAALHRDVMEGATEIVPIVADAGDFAQDPLARVLSAADLVVDASTTIEYPRAVSAVDSAPRHVSVFATPNGNAAVLLAEDRQRARRLRTLEAQYYRALIQTAWGEAHLGGHTSTFWSGTSCRDISFVMPYSRLLGHASTLAEQIQAATERQEALIRVWQRDPVRGSVDMHDVPVLPERRMVLGTLDLFLDEGVEQQLRAFRQGGAPNETGGVLLGYYDFNIKAVVIVAGLPAPLDSKATPDSFERGVSGLTEAVKDAVTRTAGMVNYIGEWHSHPPGHSATPSHRDLLQLVYLAIGMADDGLPAVQVVIGEDDLQVMQGVVR